MHFFLCLFLGHLLGDFPLQTDAVYRLKTANGRGVFLHAGIVTAVTLALVFPYGFKAALGVLTVGVLHGAVDALKLSWQRAEPRHAHALFWLDQTVHVGLLLLLAAVLGFPRPETCQVKWLPAWYWEPAVLGTAAAFLIAAFFGAIWVQTAAAACCLPGDRQREVWLTQEEKWTGIIERTMIAAGVGGGWAAFWLGGLALGIGIYAWRWRNWMSFRFWAARSLLGWMLAAAMGLAVRFII